ncbi:MAG: heme o synthase [Gemmataceae bacterium]
MKTADAAICPHSPPLARVRFLDYLELAKPRVAVLVLFTVAVGALLAQGSLPSLTILVHTLVGTALVAAGASTLNQLMERRLDALMRRTENRPLPSGRVQPIEALIIGTALGISGVVYLAFELKEPWAALVAGGTFVCYVFVYTPLKQRTPHNTLIGAIPGALPPLIGWAAIRGPLSLDALSLFLIVFFWQLPHFYAIAWIYRAEYAAAGYRMVSTVDRTGRKTARGMVGYCAVLLLASLIPWLTGRAGTSYGLGALLLGAGFLASTLAFAGSVSEPQARRVLKVSLIYLPAVFALLVLDTCLRTW